MGHWYDRETGAPRYTVPYSDPSKGERDTTLSDAKKLGLVPSVTTIIGQLDKPALLNYKINQLLDATIKAPYQRDVDMAKWRSAIINQSNQHSKNAAKRGNEIHDALEHYFNNKETKEEAELIIPVFKLIETTFPGVGWDPEVSFTSKKYGYGGKIDLVSKDRNIIIDFKTKDLPSVKKVVQYNEHHMQTSAYGVGLNGCISDCYNLFISTNTPGEILLLKSPKTDRYWDMFESLLMYWIRANDYNPQEPRGVT